MHLVCECCVNAEEAENVHACQNVINANCGLKDNSDANPFLEQEWVTFTLLFSLFNTGQIYDR